MTSSDDESSDFFELDDKLKVLYAKLPELLGHNDVKYIGRVEEARKELISRSDINYYITDEDLLKIKNSSKKIYLRLVIETPHKKKVASINISGLETNSPKISPKPSPKVSPKAVNNMIASDGCSNLSPNTKTRVINRRSNSVNESNNVNINKHKAISLSAPNVTTNFANTSISIKGKVYILNYTQSDIKYNIFVLEKVGTADTNLKSFGLTDAKMGDREVFAHKIAYVNKIEYKNKFVDFTIYIPLHLIPNFPIYFQVATIDYECTIEDFLSMAEEVIKLAYENLAGS